MMKKKMFLWFDTNLEKKILVDLVYQNVYTNTCIASFSKATHSLSTLTLSFSLPTGSCLSCRYTCFLVQCCVTCYVLRF